MPTYSYECSSCGHTFEHRQSMSDEPLTVCPKCNGPVRRLISGGTGFVLGGRGHSDKKSGACTLETEGRTCCGVTERCGAPKCGE